MLNKNKTSNTLTTLTLLVQVYLNYLHSTGTQQAAQKQLLVRVSEVSKSRDWSNRYFTEAFTHSTFVIISYLTLFQKKNRQRNKQISRFVFIPELNNKLTTAGYFNENLKLRRNADNRITSTRMFLIRKYLL